MSREPDYHVCPACGEWSFLLCSGGGYTNSLGGDVDLPGYYECEACGHRIYDYTEECDAYCAQQPLLDGEAPSGGDGPPYDAATATGMYDP